MREKKSPRWQSVEDAVYQLTENAGEKLKKALASHLLYAEKEFGKDSEIDRVFPGKEPLEGATSKRNINDNVYVRLTPYGMLIWKECFEKHSSPGKGVEGFTETFEKYTDENGYTKFQLWDLLQIFGSTTYMGNTGVPFHRNEIHFCESETSKDRRILSETMAKFS